jgi:hypothetical protein
MALKYGMQDLFVDFAILALFKQSIHGQRFIALMGLALKLLTSDNTYVTNIMPRTD